VVKTISQIFHVTRNDFEKVIAFYPEYGRLLGERQK
jgi:NADH:ubiquinone oxidoreductase subunit E